MKRCRPLCQGTTSKAYFVPVLPLALCLIDFASCTLGGGGGGWGGSVGAIAIATTRPSLLSAPFYALPGCVHTSLIRTGVFCGCSGDGSPKRLGLGTAPALFPSSPRQIPSRKHFICGSGKAYVGLESAVWKAAANRLCNVFGGVVLVFTVSADLWQAEPPPQ